MKTSVQRLFLPFLVISVLLSCASPQKVRVASAAELETMIKGRNSHLDSCLAARDSLRIQVIFTRIDRTTAGKPVFTDFELGVDTGRYFYPASSVKFQWRY